MNENEPPKTPPTAANQSQSGNLDRFGNGVVREIDIQSVTDEGSEGMDKSMKNLITVSKILGITGMDKSMKI